MWRQQLLERCCRPAYLAPAPQQPLGRQRGASVIVPEDGARGGGAAWQDHMAGGMLAALAAAMAELARQVDVTCAERGAALALTWNLHSATCDVLIRAPSRILHECMHVSYPADLQVRG